MILKEIPIKFILVLLDTKPNTPCMLLASCLHWKAEFSKEVSSFLTGSACGQVPVLFPPVPFLAVPVPVPQLLGTPEPGALGCLGMVRNGQE